MQPKLNLIEITLSLNKIPIALHTIFVETHWSRSLFTHVLYGHKCTSRALSVHYKGRYKHMHKQTKSSI